MKIDIKKLSEFQKFTLIKSILKWEKENDWTTIPPDKSLDVKFLVNDKEMDVVDMFDSIEKNMDEYIEDKAEEIFNDKFFDFESEMTDVLDDIMENVKMKMLQKLNIQKHYCFSCGVKLTDKNFTEKEKQIYKCTGIEICVDCDYNNL